MPPSSSDPYREGNISNSIMACAGTAPKQPFQSGTAIHQSDTYSAPTPCGKHVNHILTAEFDIERGSSLDREYPEPTGCPEQVLAELMLPEGAHLRDEDWTFFFLNQHVPPIGGDGQLVEDASDRPPLLYCLSLVRQKQSVTAKRGSVMRAMAIATRHQFLHIYKPLLVLALDKYFVSPTTTVLAELYEAVNSMDLSNIPPLSENERLLLRHAEAWNIFDDKFEKLEREHETQLKVKPLPTLPGGAPPGTQAPGNIGSLSEQTSRATTTLAPAMNSPLSVLGAGNGTGTYSVTGDTRRPSESTVDSRPPSLQSPEEQRDESDRTRLSPTFETSKAQHDESTNKKRPNSLALESSEPGNPSLQSFASSRESFLRGSVSMEDLPKDCFSETTVLPTITSAPRRRPSSSIHSRAVRSTSQTSYERDVMSLFKGSTVGQVAVTANTQETSREEGDESLVGLEHPSGIETCIRHLNSFPNSAKISALGVHSASGAFLHPLPDDGRAGSTLPAFRRRAGSSGSRFASNNQKELSDYDKNLPQRRSSLSVLFNQSLDLTGFPAHGLRPPKTVTSFGTGIREMRVDQRNLEEPEFQPGTGPAWPNLSPESRSPRIQDKPSTLSGTGVPCDSELRAAIGGSRMTPEDTEPGAAQPPRPLSPMASSTMPRSRPSTPRVRYNSSEPSPTLSDTPPDESKTEQERDRGRASGDGPCAPLEALSIQTSETMIRPLRSAAPLWASSQHTPPASSKAGTTVNTVSTSVSMSASRLAVSHMGPTRRAKVFVTLPPAKRRSAEKRKSFKNRQYFETKVNYSGIKILMRIPLTYVGYPEEVGDFSVINLITTFSCVSSLRDSNTPQYHFPPPHYPELHTNGAATNPIILLFNALLTQKRVLFVGYGRPSREVATFVLASCALATGNGAVLRGLTERAFPYTCLANVDALLNCEGYIAGVTNTVFEEKHQWWDVLCNVVTGKITVSPQVRLRTADPGQLYPFYRALIGSPEFSKALGSGPAPAPLLQRGGFDMSTGAPAAVQGPPSGLNDGTRQPGSGPVTTSLPHKRSRFFLNLNISDMFNRGSKEEAVRSTGQQSTDQEPPSPGSSVSLAPTPSGVPAPTNPSTESDTMASSTVPPKRSSSLARSNNLSAKNAGTSLLPTSQPSKLTNCKPSQPDQADNSCGQSSIESYRDERCSDQSLSLPDTHSRTMSTQALELSLSEDSKSNKRNSSGSTASLMLPAGGFTHVPGSVNKTSVATIPFGNSPIEQELQNVAGQSTPSKSSPTLAVSAAPDFGQARPVSAHTTSSLFNPAPSSPRKPFQSSSNKARTSVNKIVEKTQEKWMSDNEFMQEISQAILSHRGELVIRAKFQEYLERLLAVAAAYEVELYGSTQLGLGGLFLSAQESTTFHDDNAGVDCLPFVSQSGENQTSANDQGGSRKVSCSTIPGTGPSQANRPSSTSSVSSRTSGNASIRTVAPGARTTMGPSQPMPANSGGDEEASPKNRRSSHSMSDTSLDLTAAQGCIGGLPGVPESLLNESPPPSPRTGMIEEPTAWKTNFPDERPPRAPSEGRIAGEKANASKRKSRVKLAATTRRVFLPGIGVHGNANGGNGGGTTQNIPGSSAGPALVDESLFDASYAETGLGGAASPSATATMSRAQLQCGPVFLDELSRRREMIFNCARFQAWRGTITYLYYQKDLQRRLSCKAVQKIDVQHQIWRLRSTGSISTPHLLLIYDSLIKHVVSNEQIIELLSYLNPHNGGLVPLAAGLFHYSPEIKRSAAQLLRRLEQHPVGRKFIEKLNGFFRRTYARYHSDMMMLEGASGVS